MVLTEEITVVLFKIVSPMNAVLFLTAIHTFKYSSQVIEINIKARFSKEYYELTSVASSLFHVLRADDYTV